MDDFLDDFSAAALAEAIEANTVESLADLGRSPRVELHREPDMVWSVTGMPHPSFNRVLHAQFESQDLGARIEAALAPFQARGVPLAWHTGPTTQPPDLGERLLARGFRRTLDEPGMAVDLWALDDEMNLSPGFTVERVSDLAGLRDWCEIFTAAFRQPAGAAEAVFAVEAALGMGAHPWRRRYVGSLRGAPVATSLLFLGAGVAGIHGVGTLPEARQRGVGAAMTATLLLEARAMDYRIGVLHASPLGVGVYRRLGFREYCRLCRYVWPSER